ncbi:MAG: hypothetical protein ABIR03_10050 [Ginsengibacter sp.]
MKIDQVLIHYLLKNKQLTLQGIGTFRLEAALPDTADPDKPIFIPENAISFQYDPKVGEDDNLVDFIIEHTGKIKPLASSDLDSYLMLGRQFLNIGNPFIIPNLGTLQKTNSGSLTFKGGQHAADRVDPQRTKIEDEGAEEHEENMFNDYQREHKTKNGRTILIGISLLIAGFIVWAIWHYAFNPESQQESIQSTEAIIPLTDSSHYKDSLSKITPLIDSNKIVRKNPSDSFTFKVVVNEFTNRQAASARFAKLKTYGRNVILYTNDSITYKIAEPFMRPLSDSIKVLDSLNRYYGKGKTKLEY